ncbi:MAG: NFACT RNA binding domain-containing protein [Parachlamydiaceae bacterium]
MSILDSWEEQKKTLRQRLKRKLRTALKYQAKCHRQLALCLGGEKAKHEAELLKAHLYNIAKGAKTVIVYDWLQENQTIEIALDPSLKPHEEVAIRFKRAKKLIKGLPHAERELALAQSEVRRVQELIDRLEAIDTDEKWTEFEAQADLPPFQKKEKTIENEPRKPYLETIAPDGTLIWIGRSAKDNDELTFRWASGNDYWAHAVGVSGSHVIAKMAKGKELSDEALQTLLREALLHSKAKTAKEGEVAVTQVKFVKRLGKAKGKVQIANEKRYFTRLPL